MKQVKKTKKKYRFVLPPALFLFFMLGLAVSLLGGCKSTEILNKSTGMLEPGDFLNTPRIFDVKQDFGHLGTFATTVPATCDIFLAEAPDGTEIKFPVQNQKDVAPKNSPIIALDGIIRGGETIDIYAEGQARHEPLPSINFGPNGWEILIEAGPAREYEAFEGAIGALVGLFNNQSQPFVIGRRKQLQVPRGAKRLYLAMMDFPGASSNNQGEYLVTIDVIRR